jgi:hypothetical protein
MRLIVPGVLAGSKGALYYPATEIGRNPDSWNGMPIVVTHPFVDGEARSARDPSILEQYEVGRVFNAYADGSGPLDAEGWFDVELVQNHDRKLPNQNKILPRLERGEPVELSTGLYTTNEPAVAGSVFNEKSYDYVARNYRPDHLAILPDQPGACSLKDGCGVHMVHNACCEACAQAAVQNSPPNQPKSVATGKYKPLNAGTGKGHVHESAQAGFLQLSDQDHNLGKEFTPGGSTPAWVDSTDKGQTIWGKALLEAAKAGHEGLPTYGAAAAHIYQRLGGKIVELPATNSNLTINGESMNRKKIIAHLVTNCAAWKGQETALNAMTDEQLKLQLNGFPFKKKEGEAPAEEEEEEEEPAVNEEEEEEATSGGGCAPKMNKGKKAPTANRLSFGEMLEHYATPAEKAVWNHAVAIEKKERQAIVAKLVANIADGERKKAKAKKLLAMPLADLQELAELIPAPVTNKRKTAAEEEEDDLDFLAVNTDFSGAAGGPSGNSITANVAAAGDDDDILMPTLEQ